jgi:hypothetical protein
MCDIGAVIASEAKQSGAERRRLSRQADDLSNMDRFASLAMTARLERQTR